MKKWRYRVSPNLCPLIEFAEHENVHPVTVTQHWMKYGQAPDLTRIGRRVFISVEAWDSWNARRKVDRTRTGKPGLRAPLPTTPRPRKEDVR